MPATPLTHADRRALGLRARKQLARSAHADFPWRRGAGPGELACRPRDERAMQLTPDPFLGYTTIDGRDLLVRQLNDHKASLDLKALTADSLLGCADACGELFAPGHARAGGPVTIVAYLGTSERFAHAILSFARAYADKTEKDWTTLKKSKV